MNFNVTYAANNKINITSQNTLTVSKMVINEVVDTSCDLIEETNIDIKLGLSVINPLTDWLTGCDGASSGMLVPM